MAEPGPTRDLDALVAALEAVPMPAAVRDGGGRYVAVNCLMSELIGLPAERITGKSDSALQPADLANRTAEIDGLVLGSGTPLDNDESLLCRFGRKRLRACRQPLLDGDSPWAVAVVLGESEHAGEASAARDRLAQALVSGDVHATAPPAPDAAVGERADELERRAEEAAERADEAAAQADQARLVAEAAEARAAEARTERDAEREARAAAEARIAEAEAWAQEAQQRAAEAEARVHEVRARAEEAGSRAEQAERRLAEVHARAEGADGRLSAAHDRAQEAEHRAQEAYARAEEAEGRAQEAHARADEAEARAHEAHARAEAAERRAAELQELAETAEARHEESRARTAEAEGRLNEARVRAEEANRRAAEAEARAEALAGELEAERVARLDAEALLRRERRIVPAAGAGPADDPQPDGPAPAPEWSEADVVRLSAALRGASSLRGAARAVLSTVGPAAGFTAGAVWHTSADGSMECVDAWTAPGESGIAGWETTAWHARLRAPGLVPDALMADGPVACPVEGDCPRAESARHAGLQAVVLLPVGDDLVVELLRRQPVAAEPLDGLAGLRDLIAEARERLGGEAAPAWSLARL
ncbi:MAG TPA: PAS domain-containing protein [Baekduia sp.]|nr:PAS domain-containing protein [Baekduia sp.]